MQNAIDKMVFPLMKFLNIFWDILLYVFEWLSQKYQINYLNKLIKYVFFFTKFTQCDLV